MDKDLTKMDQLRAFREAKSSRGSRKPGREKLADESEAPTLSRGIRVAPKVALDPSRRVPALIEGAGVATGPREAKFDRKTYQREYMREYMRKWRRTRNDKGGV